MLNAMLRNNRSEGDDEYDFAAILRSKAFYEFTLATAELQRVRSLSLSLRFALDCVRACAED
jgi:hypothetical protein